jgi:hypothetical protein
MSYQHAGKIVGELSVSRRRGAQRESAFEKTHAALCEIAGAPRLSDTQVTRENGTRGVTDPAAAPRSDNSWR